MDKIRTDILEQVDQLRKRYHEGVELIDSEVCFVLAI